MPLNKIMEVQEIQEVIRTSRAINIPDSVIRQNLVTKHFDPAEIDKAFSMLPPSDVEEQHQEAPLPAYQPAYTPAPQALYQKRYGAQAVSAPAIPVGNTWYVIEQILFFCSLYLFFMSAFLTLQFNIDRWFSADFLGLSLDTQIIAIRIFLAALLVSLPVFSYFFLSIMKYPPGYLFMRNPFVTKIAISTTFLLSFLGILMSSVFIVFHLLNGTITTVILLHWFTSFAVTTGIFIYYLFRLFALP